MILGTISAARIPKINMTTMTSISVNPLFARVLTVLICLPHNHRVTDYNAAEQQNHDKNMTFHGTGCVPMQRKTGHDVCAESLSH